jgi:hypothetical protein
MESSPTDLHVRWTNVRLAVPSRSRIYSDNGHRILVPDATRERARVLILG